MRNSFIIDAIRTPIGKYAGSLANIRCDDLAAIPIRELIARNQTVDPSRIDDVYFGCANQAGEDNRNIARTALLLAGLPESVPGETVNRLCASGAAAVARAAHAIAANEGELFIAGGVEHMTRAPYVMEKIPQAFGRGPKMYDTTIGWRFVNPLFAKRYGVDEMGQTAENVAEQFQISRDDQDKFALSSQQKVARAKSQKRFQKEIISVEIPRRKQDPLLFDEDEFPRPDSSLEALSKLRTAFKENGTVTAGNASGINDGACAILVASEGAIKEFNLKPRARIVASATAGVEPRIMGIGPVPATEKVLSRAQLSLDQIAVVELNEAFAAQSLAVLRELGIADEDPRVNPNGGAIALGHPLGMSGARLLQTAAIELAERNEQYALVTMCIGVGQGMAMVIERV